MGWFQPDLDTDDTYQRFVIRKPTGSVVSLINYSDNPWRSRALVRRARTCARMLRTTSRISAFGAVSGCGRRGDLLPRSERPARERSAVQCAIDPLLKVHAVFDLGYADYVDCLGAAAGVRDSGDPLHRGPSPHAGRLFGGIARLLKFNWGTVYLPHDGRAKRLS